MAIGTVLSIISICIGLFFSSFALFFSLKNNKRTDVKEIEQRVKETAEINVKLDFITQNTNEIKNEVITIKQDVKSHHDDIIKIKADVGSLEHRIDEIEGRVDKYHG